MQADSIFEKAKKLGLDTGNSVNQIENLRTIADQLGVEDLSELDEALDNLLAEGMEENLDDAETIEEVAEEPELHRKESFGEKEYNQAKDENGNYDKDYYKNRGEELDRKVEEAKQERDRDTKEELKKEETPDEKKLNASNNGESSAVNRSGKETKTVETSEGTSRVPKSKWDRAKDNINLASAQKDRALNKFNAAKAKAYQYTHPGEMLKNKVQSVASNAAHRAGDAAKAAGKKAAQTAGKATSEAGKAVGKAVATGVKAIVQFLLANPILLIIIAVLILVLFFLTMIFGGSYNHDEAGYYDAECNYNDTKVKLRICTTEETKDLSLKDYVLGMANSYAKGKTYSDETLKTLMIVLKTNALSLGNYNSYNKEVILDDCSQSYMDLSTESGNSNIESLYASIEEEIFVSNDYQDVITNLSPNNQLQLDNSIVNQIEGLSKTMTYDKILDELYNPKDNSSVDIVDNKKNTVFVGDSRISQMLSAGLITSENTVYNNSNGGISWFTSSISTISSKISSNENVVIWFGLNDLHNYETLYQKYYELANTTWKNNNIFIVSVGYVNETKASISNTLIESFNFEMKKRINGSGLNNLKFIDLEYNVTSMSSNTLEDGIAYNNDLIKGIYNKINNRLGSVTSTSVVKSIYKLSTYCTYYTLSSNAAYWWPIGSSNETAPNIYGGNPITVGITSPFGMREHPKTGAWKMHTGIDISDGEFNRPIIAVKSGTVTAVVKNCVQAVDDKDERANCGGGYGNYILIDHGNGISSFYGHLQTGTPTVSVGDTVTQGQKIADIGSTGISTGPHLHFEIRLNGTQVNPLDYISADNPRPVSANGLENVDDNVTGASETKSAVCTALLSSSFSKNAVAGILANITNESAFRTNNLEDSFEAKLGSDEKYTIAVDNGTYSKNSFVNDSAGYGLFQWTYSTRKAGLYDYVKRQGGSISLLSNQMGYFLQEIKSSDYNTSWKYLNGNYSAYDITYNFCLNYENPANKYNECKSRANNSQSALQYVNNGCK